MDNIELFSLFDIGDELIINKRPTYWSSKCSIKYPLDGSVVFPYKLVIKDIRLTENGNVSISDTDDYGWSLSSFVLEKCIDDLDMFLRRKKLLKLKNNIHGMD